MVVCRNPLLDKLKLTRAKIEQFKSLKIKILNYKSAFFSQNSLQEDMLIHTKKLFW